MNLDEEDNLENYSELLNLKHDHAHIFTRPFKRNQYYYKFQVQIADLENSIPLGHIFMFLDTVKFNICHLVHIEIHSCFFWPSKLLHTGNN